MRSLDTVTDGERNTLEHITYFDALSEPGIDDPDSHVNRYLCSQSALLTMRGVPGIYFHSLTATPNNVTEMAETGRARTINRKKWNIDVLEALLADHSSKPSKVFRRYIHMLNCRRTHAAFHPAAEQKILDLGPDVFAVLRNTPGGSQRVLALHNFTDRTVTLEPVAELDGDTSWGDLLAGGESVDDTARIVLQPHEVKWLAHN